MNTKTKMMLRITVPLAIVASPLIIGRPILLFIQSSVVFTFSAIIPQYVIWPYLSYYNEVPKQPFWPYQYLAVLIHWTCVFAVYVWITRKISLPMSFAVFGLLGVASILLVHCALKLFGYQFELDSL